jgi:hypothetical protein
MSASAHGKVVYGFGPRVNEYLRVASGTHWVCSRRESHDIGGSRKYCPDCGDRVEELPRMVPSKLAEKYAKLKGGGVLRAVEILEDYQHMIRGWDGYLWVFGVEVVSGSGGTCSTFQPGTIDPLDSKLVKGMEVLGELYDSDLSKASYHLIVSLH